MKKIIPKIILYTVASITFLVLTTVLLVVLLIYGKFNNQIARVINSQSEKLINGRLTVGSIEGRMFEGFTIDQILLTQDGDTIVYAGSWQTQFKLKSLLEKKIHINSVSIDDLMIRLEQDTDSVWNLLKIIPEQENVPEDTTSSPFSWEIALDDFYLNHMDLYVQTQDTMSLIPDQVHARLHLQFAMKKSKIMIKLFDSQIITIKPGLHADQLSFNLTMDGDSLAINQFKLQLPGSQMTAHASLDLSSPENLSANFAIPSLSFDDFRDFLGIIPLYGKPSIQITAENRTYTIGIWNLNQDIRMTASLSGTDSLARFTASAQIKNLNLSEWTRDPELHTNVTGTLEISGSGLSIAENQINTSVNLPMLEFAGYSAALQMSARKKGSNVTGMLNADSKIGKINSEFSLNQIFKLPEFQINTNISKFNLSEITKDTLLTSDLNFNIGIQGKGTDPETMEIAAGIYSGYSTIAGIEMDSLAVTGHYNNGHYGLKEFLVQTSPFILEAFGEGDINGSHHLGYHLSLKDVSSLGRILGADSLAAEGFAGGTLSGTLKDAEIVQKIRLHKLKYNDITMDSLQLSLNGFIQDTLYTGNLEAGLKQIKMSGLELETLDMHSVYDGVQLQNELQVCINQDSRAEALFTIRPEQTLIMNMPQFNLIYKDITWLGKADTLSFDPVNSLISASGISFESDDQKIELDAAFSKEDSAVALFTVNNLDLAKLPLELFTGSKPEGKTDFFASLSGTAVVPHLEAGLEITGFRMDSLALDTIRTNVFYDEEVFRIKGSVDGYETSLVQFDGILPYHFSLADSMYVLPDDNRLSLEVVSTMQNLQSFSGFFPEGITLDGASDIRVNIRNNLNNPDLRGSIRLADGLIRYPKYGIDMRNLQLAGNLGQMRLQLDSIRMESGRGFMKVDGFVQIKGMETLEIQSFGLNLQSNRFTVTNGPQAEIIVNSKLKVVGNPESADFSGNMTIEQGLIHIDAIMSQFGMVADDPNPPLLLQAIEQSREEALPDSLTIFESSDSASDAFKNLKGEIGIDIPGNFWIRGKDMNFELGGNLRAIAEGGQVDLFGPLDIRRGHYTVYGKRLVVNTGKIELTGGSEINPILDVEIGYSFRDDEKQLRNLTVGVSGRALQPTIAFQMDGERIEEKDGISYLIFGKSMDELTQGEQSSVDYNVADIGKSLALGQLSGLVQGALQSSLGLDVVDIEGSDDWSSGSLTIGKYIARNLFLSYSREFSMDRKNKISHPDNISLEYQILKWLYLQAVSQGTNSGFDLIIQKKWK